MLLEWAGGTGALNSQDAQLAAGSVVDAYDRKGLEAVREALRTALRKTGIGDPAAVAAAIRKRMILNECEKPEQPAMLWRSQAITEVAGTDFAGKIHTWYDNTMARAIDSYALFAKIVASAVALVVVMLVQLDTVNVIRRLSQDDKLRASLVAEAEMQLKRQEEASKAKEGVPEEDAKAQREQIAASLADLRDPKRGITPQYLLAQPVAQTRICPQRIGGPPGNANMRIVAGADSRPLAVSFGSTRGVNAIAAAVRQSGAPVTIYHDNGCLLLVAQNADIDRISVFEENATNEMSGDAVKAWDAAGFRTRLPGVFLSWILVSLGAPFWYDLLKKLIGFRSLIAQKDDADRKFRANEQPSVAVEKALDRSAEAPKAAAAAATAGAATGLGDLDERGDLEATGAEG